MAYACRVWKRRREIDEPTTVEQGSCMSCSVKLPNVCRVYLITMSIQLPTKPVMCREVSMIIGRLPDRVDAFGPDHGPTCNLLPTMGGGQTICVYQALLFVSLQKHHQPKGTRLSKRSFHHAACYIYCILYVVSKSHCTIDYSAMASGSRLTAPSSL